MRLIDAVGFSGGLTERTEHEVALQRIDGSEYGGGFAGDGGDSAGGVRGGGDSGRRRSGLLPRGSGYDDGPTPRVVTDPLFVPADLVEGAIAIALTQIGVRETGPNTGPEVDRYLASVGLHPGQSWCAAFVHWVFQEASLALDVLNPCPKTGGVLHLWELAADNARTTEPTKGAIVIMDHGGGHGHTGIVESVNGGGLLESVEGNTSRGGSRNGDAVWRHIWRPEDGARGRLVGYLDFSRVPLVSRKPGAT
jgi:hypothetical protein